MTWMTSEILCLDNSWTFTNYRIPTARHVAAPGRAIWARSLESSIALLAVAISGWQQSAGGGGVVGSTVSPFTSRENCYRPAHPRTWGVDATATTKATSFDSGLTPVLKRYNGIQYVRHNTIYNIIRFIWYKGVICQAKQWSLNADKTVSLFLGWAFAVSVQKGIFL